MARVLLDEYETTRDTAERLGVTVGRIKQMIWDDRFDGVIKINSSYLIPKDSWPRPLGRGRPPTWQEKVEQKLAERDGRYPTSSAPDGEDSLP